MAPASAAATYDRRNAIILGSGVCRGRTIAIIEVPERGSDPRPRIVLRRVVGRNDHLADRPKRDAGKLQMRPGEGNADDGEGQQNSGDHMAEREPPACQHQPDDITEKAERSGAGIVTAKMVGARYGLAAERKERIGGDVE